MAESCRVPAMDGYQLGAWVTRSAAGTADWVVLSTAFGTAARFYASFAQALADAGFAAISYDYRGIGASRPARMRGFEATMTDWAVLDLAGVVRWVHQSHRPRRLLLVGHSTGGILAGMAGIGDLVDAMVTVGSENTYWRDDTPRRRVSQWTLVALTWPVTAVFGYSPWSRFSRAQDVPSGAARQMAASILRPGGVLADPDVPADRYAEFTAPVLAYSIADDEFATAPSVDDLAAAYPNSTRRHVHPAQAGLDAVGHFGYFRPRSRALWDDPITWLDQQPPRSRR